MGAQFAEHHRCIGTEDANEMLTAVHSKTELNIR